MSVTVAREVAEGVYAVNLAWGVAYILTNGKEAALIDTGLKKDRPALLEALRGLGLKARDVRSVYLTHAHCDHAGNAAFFAQQGAKLHVHRDEAGYIGKPRHTYIPAGFQFLAHPHSALLFAGGEALYPVERRNPDVLLEEGEALPTPAGPLRVLASPGHTPGHISYYRSQDEILFSGDAILTIIPIVMREELSLPMRVFSTDWELAKQSARALAAIKPRALLPGHGKPLTHDTAERLASWAAHL